MHKRIVLKTILKLTLKLTLLVLAKVTDVLTTVTLASTSNALPDDGVTAPKQVGTVLMSILM
jgi:hypothetical protein